MSNRKVIWVLPALLLTIVLFASCVKRQVIQPTEAPLETAPTMTLEEALRNGKPTLADFGSDSDSCAPCRIMKSILEEVAAEYKGRLNVLIIDVYKNRQLAIEYGIMTIPTQILFDRDGKIVAGNVGVLEKQDIIAALEKFGVLNE